MPTTTREVEQGEEARKRSLQLRVSGAGLQGFRWSLNTSPVPEMMRANADPARTVFWAPNPEHLHPSTHLKTTHLQGGLMTV